MLLSYCTFLEISALSQFHASPFFTSWASYIRDGYLVAYNVDTFMLAIDGTSCHIFVKYDILDINFKMKFEVLRGYKKHYAL